MKKSPKDVDMMINEFLKRKSQKFPEIDSIVDNIARSNR